MSPLAAAVKILGAERPNVMSVSTKEALFHSMPSHVQSLGCTGTMRYAFFRSNFAISAPWPSECRKLTA